MKLYILYHMSLTGIDDQKVFISESKAKEKLAELEESDLFDEEVYWGLMTRETED